MNELPTPLYWQFDPLFLCKLLQFSHIWRVPSPNCCFQISPQVFNGIWIWTHCWALQNNSAFCLEPFLGAFWNVFGVIVLLQDPWPSKETQPSDTGLNIELQNASLVISWFHDPMHTFKAPSARGSTATLKHHWTSSMFDCREGVLFFEGFILFSVNIEMMCFTKKL